MARRRLVTAAALLLAGALLAGCGGKVSRSNYDKIEEGMTMEEVEGLLGEGEKASGGVSVAGLDLSGTLYVWQEGDKKIMVTFTDNKVVGKAQEGL